MPTGPPRPPLGTLSYNTIVSLGSLGETGGLPAIPQMTGTVPSRSSLKDDMGGADASWWSPPPIETDHGPLLFKAELDTPIAFADDPTQLAQPNSSSVGSPDFVDETEAVKEAFTYSLMGSGIEGTPREQFSVAGVDAVTPASYLYDKVGLTQSSDERIAYILTKRSLDAQNFGILPNSYPDTGLQRDGIASRGPEVEATEARPRVPEITMDSVVNGQMEKLSNGPDAQAFKMAERHSSQLKMISRDIQNQAEDLRTPMTEIENISAVHKDMMGTGNVCVLIYCCIQTVGFLNLL